MSSDFARERLRDLPGLIEAVEHPQLFGVTPTPRQRDLLSEIAEGGLVHVWALGRRSGKSLLGALVALWFCLLRPDLAEFARRGERRYCVAVATSQRQSRIYVQQAREIIDGSPYLRELVESATDDEILFKTGTALRALPATSRGARGLPVMFVLFDEAAHMLDTDGNQAAEPLFRSLVPSIAQFGAEARVVVASSPYGDEGFFADLFHQVERGELPDAVCQRAGTLEMRPDLATAALELERLRDPESWRAEYGAEFVTPGGAYLDAARIAEAVGRERELAPGELVAPVPAADLAFERDSTGLVIVGRDPASPERLRLAVARSWAPRPGRPLSFAATLDEIADVCLRYGARSIAIDQFSAASAREHLQRRGLAVTVVPTTAASKSAMFADLKQRVYDGALELFDHPDLLAELRRIETVSTPGAATVRIRRLGSSHGDLATALALACSRIRGTGRHGSVSVPRGRIPDAPRGRYPLRGRGLLVRDVLAERLGAAGVRVDGYDTSGLAARLGRQP